MNELKEIIKFYQEIGADFLKVSQNNPRLFLNRLNQAILSCQKCALYKTKTNYVPGEGSLTPDILFIGEGPGETEDKFGKPFIGKAGQLLERLIVGMKYSRETVFISNIVKCRPPKNRNPLKKEVAACIPYLREQIEILKPKVIVCLGKIAFNNLLDKEESISKYRGKISDYCGIPVIPTFHPSYILHQSSKQDISRAKWEVWNDMQKVIEIIKSS